MVSLNFLVKLTCFFIQNNNELLHRNAILMGKFTIANYRPFMKLNIIERSALNLKKLDLNDEINLDNRSFPLNATSLIEKFWKSLSINGKFPNFAKSKIFDPVAAGKDYENRAHSQNFLKL